MSVTVDSKDAKLIGGGYRGALTRVGLHQARRMGECIMCGAVCYMVLYGAVWCYMVLYGDGWCCVVMGGVILTFFLLSLSLSLSPSRYTRPSTSAPSSASGTASLLKEWGPYDLWCVLYAVSVVHAVRKHIC